MLRYHASGKVQKGNAAQVVLPCSIQGHTKYKVGQQEGSIVAVEEQKFFAIAIHNGQTSANVESVLNSFDYVEAAFHAYHSE